MESERRRAKFSVLILWVCLDLLELVSGSGTNLALNKPTYQVATSYEGTPDRAVDGIREGDFSAGSCSHTNYPGRPKEWWVVDLQESYTVTKVSITNRLLVPERLANFYIRVGDAFDEQTFDPTTYALCWYQLKALNATETRTLCCDAPVTGRFVTVHFPADRSETLTLCEVEVYDGSSPPPCDNRAASTTPSTMTISSTPSPYKLGVYKKRINPQNFTILYSTMVASDVYCAKTCAEEPNCDAVKVIDHVTGTGSHVTGKRECVLLKSCTDCEGVGLTTGAYVEG